MTVLDLLHSSGYSEGTPENLASMFLMNLVNTEPSNRRNYFLDKPSSFLAIDTEYYKGLSLKDLANLGTTTGKVQFKCLDCGYGFSFTPSEVVFKKTKYGCACCTGRVVVPGINDLASNDNHDLLKDWDYSKNRFLPTEVTYMSSKVVNWVCHTCGYSWKKDVSTRNNLSSPRGCPVCSNQKVQSGVNDFATKNKDYMHLWDYSKNSLDPTKITPSNSQKVYMLCEQGHSFSAKCNNLTTKLQQCHVPCPYCSRKKVMSGLNDAATLYPFILDKWDYSRNSFLPTEVQPFSNNKVWWICKDGHSWQTTIGYMCRENTGCPTCWANKGVSSLEKEVAMYVEGLLQGKDVVSKKKSYNHFFAKEVDIVVEGRNLGVEVNGVYYHSTNVRKDPLYHKKKSEDARKYLNLSLLFIWEDDWNGATEECKFLLDCYFNGSELHFPYFQKISYSTALRRSRSMVGVLPQGANYYLGRTKGRDLLFAEIDGTIVYSSNIFLLLNSLNSLNLGIDKVVVQDGLSKRLDSILKDMELVKKDLVDKNAVLNNIRTDEVDTGIYCYSDGLSVWRFR